MKLSLVLLTVLLLSTNGFADEAIEQRTQAVFALVRAARLQQSPSQLPCKDCSCKNNECEISSCACATSVTGVADLMEWVLFQVQRGKALSANKPLLVWVGESCPTYERAWVDFVHARLTKYDGDRGVEKGPLVLVCKPDGSNKLSIVARLAGIPERTIVDGSLFPQEQIPPSPVSQITPPFFTLPMQPMFNGFSGGGSGGGGC